jgi:hypothetical protein
MLLPHVQQRIDRRIAAGRERARPFYEAHPDRAPDWFKAESRVIPLVRRPRPDLPPTAMSQQFPPPANNPITASMNPSLEITADPAAIQKSAAQAGPYFTARLAEMLAAPSLDDLLTLDYVHAGRAVKILALRISPYLDGRGAVLPLQRLVMISSEALNETHAAKLSASVRRAMENRDPNAAAREIKALGSPVGFETVVIGA